jgi:RNA polymerase sigma-70 factor (ECF subfamily)
MSVDVLPEDILLKRIAQDDEEAFRIIFDRYKHRFYGAALKMTRSPDLAEETVQEVFLTLWLRRSSLANVKNPASYLLTMAYNNIANQFKKIAREKRIKESMIERTAVSECPTEAILEEKENRQLLHNIICQLPSQQQLIYRLSKQDSLNRHEIAEQLQISPNTVKNHLLKAMKYIKAHFKEALLLLGWFFIHTGNL